MNSFVNKREETDNEYVLVFQPVWVRRCDILQQATMQPNAPSAPKPVIQGGRQFSDGKQRQGLASEKQKSFILGLATDLNMTEREVCQEIGIRRLDDMTNAQANEFITEHKNGTPRF